ncbi:hypothetical protein [Nitratireductor sp. ZSWI3]|uniref:hypothetical protein n=1 Tax=Nitratireductor sp. ZSWI3 TaxID=2966359 RepID=UPI0021500479|nr:hypothetical protein [Nitratireductor sp. ZSWI3]MCR4268107.1 hypothetical protein [Nitratireductor sp. ZSWI3]
MLSHALKLKSLPFAALLSATALQAAWAWEAEDVAERYKTVMARQGIEVAWTGVSQDGNSVVLEGHSLGLANVGKSIDLGDLALQDVSETDSAYEIGHIAVDTFRQSEEGFDFAANGLAIDGLILPKEGADEVNGGLMQYKRFALDDLSIGTGGDPLFTLNDLIAETTVEDGGLIKFTGSADRLWADLGAIAKNGEASAALKEYGYEEISGRIDMEGDWRLGDGRMTISRYDVKLDNAGTLGIKADISGYTPDFVKALQEMQAKMENATQEQQQAQGLAMLGLMQQLNLHGASIRFSDASLTGKILSYVAAQQGVQPGDVANQAKAIVPLMAGQYLGPELTQSLSKAITTYIDDPRSLEISVAPSEPMPFAVLMGTAMGSPEALAKQVGLSVTANE